MTSSEFFSFEEKLVEKFLVVFASPGNRENDFALVADFDVGVAVGGVDDGVGIGGLHGGEMLEYRTGTSPVPTG